MTDSAPGQLTRQELYDRIRESSKDEYILEEMKRLGFWKNDEDMPSLPEQLIQRRGELQRELNELLKKQRIMSDPDRLLKEMRKERMRKAREKREETKKKNEQLRKERAEKWQQRNSTEVMFVGETVSAGLGSEHAGDNNQLNKFNLPSISDGVQLANLLDINLNELRFLSYSRPGSKVHHYRRFEIPKKTGGTRLISTPMPRLKKAQYWILENILNQVPVHEAAHGFMTGKSIVSNAMPHLQSDVVINMDLENFFPTITYRRVKGLFQKLGYAEKVATLLALLCTEHPVDEIELDGEVFYVAQGERQLPQGAPTSPMISNLITYRLDKRLAGVAKALGLRYSRYADDLTFSIAKDKGIDVNGTLKKLFWRVKGIIQSEGFIIHPDKTRIMRKGMQQEVTGIVVNDKLSVDRKQLRRFRAFLHQLDKDGPDGKQWGAGPDLYQNIKGYAHYIKMVDPEKGKAFIDKVEAIADKHQLKSRKTPAESTPVQTPEPAVAPAAQQAEMPKTEQPKTEQPKTEQPEAINPDSKATLTSLMENDSEDTHEKKKNVKDIASFIVIMGLAVIGLIKAPIFTTAALMFFVFMVLLFGFFDKK
jgi:retron-type reverse transcriptase